MEKKHRNILQTSNVFLTKNIHNVGAICDCLYADGILTSGMMDTIMVQKPAPTAQVREMLCILPRRGARAYESFVAALIKTENEDISDVLREKEDPTSSQNSAKPKPKNMSGDDPRDVQASTKSQCEKGDDTKKSERPPQNIQDEGWPDLQNGVPLVIRNMIQFTSREDLTRISENHKTYHMTGKNKGKLITISNVPEQCKTVSCKPGRTTCSRDVDFDKTSIQQLFKLMEFEFKSKDGLQCQTGEELKKSIKEIGEDTESSYGSLVVVILSGGIGYEPGQIYDRDGVMIPRDDVLQIIRDSPAYKGKPKIVIIITYSFEETTESYDVLDASKSILNISIKPNNDDMFVVSSSPMTKMGPWMIGDNVSGSYFIQAFIHIFKNHAHKKSFLQLIEEVNELLNTAMVPELIEGKYSDKCTKTHVAKAVVLECSNEKELFLFPGLCDIPMKGWPDLQNGVQIVKENTIQFTSREDLTRISKNHKTYHMTGKNKGKLITISNVPEQCKTDSCKPGRTRTCSRDVDFDKTSIQQLFKLMEFEFKSKDGLQCQTGEELKKSIKEIGEDTESSYDSLVVVILSGGIGYVPGQIYDKDGVMIPRDDVLQIIRDSPAFKGKPKIVIIRTYSFEETTESYDVLDASKSILNISIKPNNDDLFVVSSCPMTKMGPWMIGDNVIGSYFIQAFIYIFKNHAHEKSFLQLIEEVNELLNTAMVPELIEGKYSDKCTKTHVAKAVVLECSNEKELFLFPGLCDIPMKGWPDLQNGGQIVKGSMIQFTSREDLMRISKNHKTYHMTGKNKGKLIIISNSTEQCKTDSCKPGRKRTSSHDMDFDKTSIQQLFKLMKFELKPKAGLQCQTGEELKKSIKEIGEDTESSYDSLVVVILSGGIGYEPGQIYDRDGVMIPRDDVLQIIRDSPAFKGKPKIVIIRTYSFEETTESYDTLDASKSILNISIKPNNDDMFVVSSCPMTKMGPWMIGDNVIGSYFIQAFIHIFKNHAHEKSFLHLIEEVNKLLHTAMVPELIEGKYSDKCTNTHVAEAVVLEYSMEKELFLFPGLCDIPMKDKPEVQDNEEIKRKKRRVMVNNRVEDPGQQ